MGNIGVLSIETLREYLPYLSGLVSSIVAYYLGRKDRTKRDVELSSMLLQKHEELSFKTSELLNLIDEMEKIMREKGIQPPKRVKKYGSDIA
jgi:hypothetical protein